MPTFMVIGAFNPETDLPLMNTVLADEVAQVNALKGEGRLGYMGDGNERPRRQLATFEMVIR